MTSSLRRAISTSDGRTTKLAAAARSRVASLRPERHVMAVPPERTMAKPKAAPSPPGYRMPMGFILLLRGFGWRAPRQTSAPAALRAAAHGGPRLRRQGSDPAIRKKETYWRDADQRSTRGVVARPSCVAPKRPKH